MDSKRVQKLRLAMSSPMNFLAVIGELEGNPEIFSAEKGNHGLKFIFTFARNADLVPLDLGLDFEFPVLYGFYDIFSFFLWNAHLECDLLTDHPSQGLFHGHPEKRRHWFPLAAGGNDDQLPG